MEGSRHVESLDQQHYSPETGPGSGRRGRGRGASPRSSKQDSAPPSALGTEGDLTSSNNRSSSQQPAATQGHGAAKASSTSAVPSKPIRRRMRMITSCLECRRRKLRCNKSQPCTNCDKFARECVYLGPKLDEASQLRLTEIKEKVGSLERALERDVAKSTTSRVAKQQGFVVDDIDYGYAEVDVWPNDMVSMETSYEGDGDGAEDIIDLGVQIGRMRVTDRIGGLPRHDFAEEIDQLSSQVLAPGMAGSLAAPTPLGTLNQVGSNPDGSLPDFMRPGSTYIPPSSNFVFGQTDNPPTLDYLLPTRAACNRLISQYFRAVHPIARCLHQTTFEADYQSFWDEVITNYEPRASLQAVVFAAMFSAAASLDEDAVVQEFGVCKQTLIDNLKLGTETALCKASFIRSTKFETLQGLVMYLIPLCRAEISRGHSILVGAAVRMAECMGLHRDGESFGFSPVDTHVRRMVWHQLCFLDVRTAEAQGPRPYIRREDYDTRLPVNCDDDDLVGAVLAPASPDHWTAMVLPLIRFEINEMMRVIWVDRKRLETKKITLTQVLTKTENFRKRMIEKYEGMLNDNVPIQRYTKLVMHLLLYRLYAMILHAYHTNISAQLPARLNNVAVMAGIMIIEIAIQLENDRQYQDWAWYFGAYSQHNIALLLATEVYFRPQNREAARIWACLDYVFRVDRTLPPETKAAHILNEITAKTTAYQNMRRTRAPTSAPRSVSGAGKSPIMAHETPDMMSAHMQQMYRQHGIQQGVGHGPGNQLGGQYSGVGVGDAVWAHAAPPDSPPASTTASEAGSISSGAGARSLPPGLAPATSTRGVEGIDWDTINALFPPDPATGEINLAGYHDPSISMNWQQQQWR